MQERENGNMEFNNRLYQLRKQKGLSQEELVLGKMVSDEKDSGKKEDLLGRIDEKVLNVENKKRVGKWLKIFGIILGVFVGIDLISMIIYFFLFGAPK